MDKLFKLMEKKKQEGKQMDPMAKDAKMSMLKALRDEMSGIMKGDLEDSKLKKVEVVSNDEEGLKEGLEKAQDVVDEVSEPEQNEESMLMDAYKSDPSQENLSKLMEYLEKKKLEMGSLV